MVLINKLSFWISYSSATKDCETNHAEPDVDIVLTFVNGGVEFVLGQDVEPDS